MERPMPIDFLGMLTDHELRTLCVPLDQCVSVKTGKVDPLVLAKLEEHGYDQAPVYDAAGHGPYGLISTERLRALQSSGGEISEHDVEVREEGHFLYRNCVMHPVRPLVLSTSDVTKVRNTVVAAINLYGKVEAIRTTKPG